MKLGVIAFPDYDCGRVLTDVFSRLFKVPVVTIWHKNHLLPKVNAIFLSGGTMWLEMIGKKNIASFSPIVNELKKFATEGGYIFGTGEGFRFLCQIGLLPGKFEPNKNGKFIHKNVYIRIDNTCQITKQVDKSVCLKLPVSVKNGQYIAEEFEISTMRQNQQILFRYCDESCKISEKINYTGSIDNIAAICNKTVNVFGILPYPERACDARLGNLNGKFIIDSIFASIK
jgi:phosphoribosylformylglycinamidine synthase